MSDDIVLVDIPKTIHLKMSENLRKAENRHDFARKAIVSKLKELSIFDSIIKNILNGYYEWLL